MNRKKLYIAFICLGILSLSAQFFRWLVPMVFTSVIAFPFEGIGLLLRKLSLSGAVGNIFAIVLYACFSLVPLGVLLIISRRRKLKLEDSILILLSAVLFAVLYAMINPGSIGIPRELIAFEKTFLGGVVYSVIVSYVLLHILRLVLSADAPGLHKYIGVLLTVLGGIFVYIAFGSCFGSLIDGIESLKASNTGYEGSLTWTNILLVLQYVAQALPYILDVFIVLSGLELLKNMKADRYSADTIDAAEKLSSRCVKCLVATVLSSLLINLLQFVFIKKLLSVNLHIQIPVVAIAFVLAVLLFANYIKENKALKDDNDMFI